VFGHWLAEVIDEPVVAADEQFDLRLWAHVVGVHCNAVWPHQVTNADLIDYHCHEHEGPGTIRDHAETDRRVDLAKIYEVLGEEGAREVARLASDVAAKQRGYDDLHAMVPEPRGADIWTKVDALKRTTATLAAACDAAEERARDLAAKCERLRDEVASLREEAAIVCGMIACDRAAEIYSLYPDEDHPAGRLAWAAFDAAHGSRWSHLRWAEAEALLHCGWPQITEAERTTSGATDAIVDLQALHKPVPR
jgi:cell division protein FtsB